MRWRVASIAIVPHDHAACGKSFWMAVRSTPRNKGRCGTDKLWCRYVVACAVEMLLVIACVGVVKMCSGSIIVQKVGQR